jgi:hypothetical protein
MGIDVLMGGRFHAWQSAVRLILILICSCLLWKLGAQELFRELA